MAAIKWMWFTTALGLAGFNFYTAVECIGDKQTWLAPGYGVLGIVSLVMAGVVLTLP